MLKRKIMCVDILNILVDDRHGFGKVIFDEDADSDDEVSIDEELHMHIRLPNYSENMDKRLTFIQEDDSAYDLDDLLQSYAEVMGKDRLGTSYRAGTKTGKAVVVKRLKETTSMSHEEFERRIEEIVKLTMSHKSLLPLRAYYFSRNEKLLIFDDMPMGSLASLLHHNNPGKGETSKAPLTWKVRAGIAFEVAGGIAHLHSQGSNICHGNITSANVLLSNSFHVRLSDSGAAQLFTPNFKLTATSSGYHAPELKTTENVTQKADVYSYGVLVLELLTGKAPTTEGMELAAWVRAMFQEKPTVDVFDDVLRDYCQNFGGQMMFQLLELAICCTFQNPDRRPSMAAVASRLKRFVDSSNHS
nr:probable inactive receptor kinase RLK902 [Ipomoea batatas]GMD63127.1 probable inactive receptor kinase RLK902 [Ipomoea batatas]